MLGHGEMSMYGSVSIVPLFTDVQSHLPNNPRHDTVDPMLLTIVGEPDKMP